MADAMDVIAICKTPDMALIVDNKELHVSFAVLQQCRYFKAMFDKEKWPEGQAWQAHEEAGTKTLFKHRLDDNDSSGVTLCLAAMHGLYASLPTTYGNLASIVRDAGELLSFAKTVDKFMCAEHENIKHAASIALDAVPLHRFRKWELLPYVRAAYLLDSPDHFSKFTDLVSKYNSRQGTAFFERLEKSDQLFELGGMISSSIRLCVSLTISTRSTLEKPGTGKRFAAQARAALCNWDSGILP